MNNAPSEETRPKESKTVRYAPAIIKLLQGVLYPDDAGWELLRTYLLEVERYFVQIGLRLEYVEGEYAFLSQPRPDQSSADEEPPEILPRLIRNRSLNYHTTLLCVLLRERLIEHEAEQDQGLPTITRQEVYERMSHFIRDRGSQSTMQLKINGAITDAVELGYIKEMKDKETYQIRGIVKARITAELLSELWARLKTGTEEMPE
jgi:hypothetical protein